MKTSWLYFVFSFFLLSACTQDFSVVDQQKTRVVVDSFTQADQLGSLDVLVVLDRSGSMNDDADEVGSGIELFRLDIESLTQDYRFGFITADSSNLGYSGYYDSSTSAIEMMLAPSLLPSAHDEAGFEATYIFLVSEDGESFRRQSADFLLFLISDEDEQSSITSEIFYGWLQEEFTDVNHDAVTITTIDDGECNFYGIGYKYIELSNLYKKDSIDICGEDWEVWLSNSTFLTRLVSSVMLSQIPVAESIVVYVDGESIYRWSYDEDINTVYLDEAPGYGSLIEVGYKVLEE